MNSESIVKAVLTTLDPNVNNLERTKSYKMIEEYKTNVFHFNDLPVLCGSNQHPSVILFGLQCLEHRIKRSWNQITVEMKGTIKESLFQLALNLQNLIPASAERKVVSSVLAHLFVYLIKCEWPQHWPSMLDEFFTLGRKGQIQAKLTLNTLLRLYEDVMQFQDVPQPRRRDILSTLNDNLLLLFSFAFEIILDQLRILESQTNDPQCAISLCREALAMLSGYLDSCRVDVLSQWKPHGVTEEYAAPELPFIRLLVDLIWLEGTRIEALDLLLLLLKRKQQGSDDSSSKLAGILFMDPISVNKILMVLCSTLNEPLTFSEAKYNILLLVSEVVSRLGCQMVSRWTKYASHSSPCECASRMEFSCSNISTHILDCVLRITSHPIRMISASANLFWLAAFGSQDASLILRLTPFVPTLFMSWRRSLKKEGFPNDSGTHSEWARGVFDSDEYSGFFAKYRSEVIRCLNLANSHWPVEILQMITALANDLLKTSYRTTGDFEPRSECPSSLVGDWDVLELFIESTLASVKDGFAVRGQMDQFDHASSTLLRQFLQVPFSMDPNLRGKQIMCACVLMQHVNSRHDAELLVPLLSQIFACFRFNPTTNGVGPNVSVLRSKPVVDMHMSTASAFFRLTRSCPERVMTHFDGIGTEVTNLWAEPNCGMVEKCVLMEALILLCLRLPQSIEVQRDLLKQLVSHVTSAWSTPTPTSQSTPMLRLLTTCATGGSGLVSILGLDQPISAHQDFQSPYVQMRITLGQNVLALLATSRRLSEPANSQQLQQITVPLLEPVVSSVFVVVRAFNELWLPDTRALVDPSVLPAFEMTEHVKYTLLSLQIGRTDKRHLPEPKTPLERIRSSLYEHHENLLTIVGLLFTGLSPSLYHLPTDQLAMLLHQGCCAAFEHLPDLKLNSLLRLVIRQFIRGCPKEYLSTALVPLIPPIIEAVVQRLDSRWNQVTQMNQEGALDSNAVACELVEERLARLMSRTLMDMLRLIYTFNGCESLGAQSDADQADGDDGMEDINMQADTKSTTSVGPGHDVHSIGALARALIAAPTIDPQQVTADSSASCSDPLFLQCLSKCLTWPDSATCFKASQWIPTLIDALVQPVANGATSVPPVKHPLTGALAESVLFGILCGLHVNGKNAETNLSSLLLAGVRVYTSVDVSVACGNLRDLVTKVLISASSSDSMQSTQSVQQAVQNFESKLFEKSKPLADKAKRDVFRKLVQPIIGIPLSQRFRDHVSITTSLAPLARSKWRHPARNGDSSFPDSFGLSELFSD